MAGRQPGRRQCEQAAEGTRGQEPPQARARPPAERLLPSRGCGTHLCAGVIALLPLYKYTERLLAASPPQKAAQRSQGKTSVNCKSTASLHQRTEPHGQPAPWELEAQAGCREPRRGQLPGAGSRGDTCTVTDDSPQAGRGELDTLGHSLSSASPPGAPVGPRVRS